MKQAREILLMLVALGAAIFIVFYVISHAVSSQRANLAIETKSEKVPTQYLRMKGSELQQLWVYPGTPMRRTLQQIESLGGEWRAIRKEGQ